MLPDSIVPQDQLTRRRILRMLGLGGAALVMGATAPSDGVASEKSSPNGRVQTRLTEEYGLEHAFVGAGMGFVALPELVAAVSNAGGLGVLGVAPEPPPVYAERLLQIQALTAEQFGVDFFLATSPMFGPITTDAHIGATIAAKAAGMSVSVVVFHFDIPPAQWVADLQMAGIKVWVQVPSVEDALANLDIDGTGIRADGLIAQGVEAGGHSKSVTPLKTLLRSISSLVPADVVVLGAGGISTGADVASALAHGAEGVWVGTRLVASTESYAHPEWKRRIVAAGKGSTVKTKLFGPELPCEPYRVLRNRVVDEDLHREDDLCHAPPNFLPPIGFTPMFPNSTFETPPNPMPKYSALPPIVPTTGNFDEMGLPAGAGVERIYDVKPAAQIIQDMMGQARHLLETGL